MSSLNQNHQVLKEAEVVSRHLPEGFSAAPDLVTGTPPSSSPSKHGGNTSAPDLLAQPEDHLEDSLKLQGGDVHRDLFKMNARAKMQQRAVTFAGNLPKIRRTETASGREFTPSEQLAPGGFRRQFIQKQRGGSVFSNVINAPVAKSFVAFLDLYGSFAGEDLAESEDDGSSVDVEVDEEEAREERGAEVGERRPLLGRKKSSRRAPKVGDSGNVKTFFTLIKAFVGTGIMFLPKAFRNGGILFSSLVMIFISLLSCLAFHMLLQCRKACGGGGYGEIGEAISGRRFKNIILCSIVISQFGFVCAGVIFTAENLYSFLAAVTPHNSTPLSITALIGIQVILLIPLSLIRNISKLGMAALLADIFILIGITYIWTYDISHLSTHGVDPSVRLFNPYDFTLTIGSGIFTFEGIGLILPIQSSMAKPEHFPRLLFTVMFIITLIFTSIGILCYATFGESTHVLIISNYPQTSPFVNAVQFLYSLAVLAGSPVQLFPALRIMESQLFGDVLSGKRSSSLKWKKNAFRTAIVLFVGFVAAGGAQDLDKFVALIGSCCCVPLVYIYPAWLHWVGVAETRRERMVDAVVMGLGAEAMVFSTAITVFRWAEK